MVGLISTLTLIITAVSYTHLDVYKRQLIHRTNQNGNNLIKNNKDKQRDI